MSLPVKAATIHIHLDYLLLLLSSKADTHFTVSQMVEGRVDLGNAVRVHSLCPRLYIALVKLEPVSSHTAVTHVTTRSL